MPVPQPPGGPKALRLIGDAQSSCGRIVPFQRISKRPLHRRFAAETYPLRDYCSRAEGIKGWAGALISSHTTRRELPLGGPILYMSLRLKAAAPGFRV